MKYYDKNPLEGGKEISQWEDGIKDRGINYRKLNDRNNQDTFSNYRNKSIVDNNKSQLDNS